MNSTHRTPLLLLLLAIVPLMHGLASAPLDDNDHQSSGAYIYLPDEVALVEITATAGALDSILADPWDKTYRRCSVRFRNSLLDTTLDDVGFRARGNTSLMAIKKSWKLSFNTFVPDRKFYGVEKMNLNGEHNDVSIVRARLASEIYREFGAPAARASHARVTINDGAIVDGLFINVEQIDEELVQAWYGNKDGSLYKCLYKGARADLRWVWPGDGAAYANLGWGETYEEKNLAAPDFEDLADFIDFLNHSTDTAFAAGLAERFSLDAFLRAMALDVAIGHWDNYWFGANNYFLYRNTDSGRLEYLPYDLDNTFGVDFSEISWAERPLAGWGDGGYGSDGDLPPLIRRVLDTPAFTAQLRRYVRELAAGAFALPTMEPGIDAVKALITPHAFIGSYAGGAMDWGYTHSMFLDSYELPIEYVAMNWGWDHGLKPYIAQRAAYLLATVPAQPALPRIVVNEFQASNATTVADEYGEYDDWVEIYNTDVESVNLAGMSLSDDFTNPRRYQFPDTLLAPGGLLLVWCDGTPSQGPFHADFKLSASGEEIGLFHRADRACTPLDAVTFSSQVGDHSTGRMPDGGEDWQIFAEPTPGLRNDGTSGHWPGTPGGLVLHGAWPNPTRAGARISFSLDRTEELRLRVYDIRGREIAGGAPRSFAAGPQGIDWNGLDADGRRPAAGVYLLRLESKTESHSEKLLLLH